MRPFPPFPTGDRWQHLLQRIGREHGTGSWTGNWELATVSSVDAQWQAWVRSPDSCVVLDKKVAEEVEEDMNEQERSTYRWQNH